MPATTIDKKRLVDCLRNLPKEKARFLLAFYARTILESIRCGKSKIADGEAVVFNLDTLLFCERVLKDKGLAWAVSYGMELSDIKELVRDRHAIIEACEKIEQRLSRILNSIKSSENHHSIKRSHTRVRRAAAK